jgi:hypothetical protein
VKNTIIALCLFISNLALANTKLTSFFNIKNNSTPSQLNFVTKCLPLKHESSESGLKQNFTVNYSPSNKNLVNVTVETTFFRAKNCQGEAVQRVKNKYNTNKVLFTADPKFITLESNFQISITPLSAGYTGHLNNTRFCGLDGWVLNQERKIFTCPQLYFQSTFFVHINKNSNNQFLVSECPSEKIGEKCFFASFDKTN